MIPVPQRICAAGGEETTPGDCVKCCVASILELAYEDVPHFVAREIVDDGGNRLDWFNGLNLWLKRQGYPLWVKRWSNSLTAAEVSAIREERGLKPGESMPAIDMYRRRSFPDYHEGYWIGTVISENFDDSTHAVVMLNDQVAFDPSPKPRRTPYEYIGGEVFIAKDPARCKP